jgi:hypothetical protein
MNTKNKIINIQDEWERANTVLKGAQILASEKMWEDATSRAYYAAFHATQAVLLTEGLQPKSHQGTLHLFNHNFVKKGIIEPEYSQILARAAKYREEADYRHAMVFTEKQTKQTINEVKSFLKRMKLFLVKAGYKIQ